MFGLVKIQSLAGSGQMDESHEFLWYLHSRREKGEMALAGPESALGPDVNIAEFEDKVCAPPPVPHAARDIGPCLQPLRRRHLSVPLSERRIRSAVAPPALTRAASPPSVTRLPPGAPGR